MDKKQLFKEYVKVIIPTIIGAIGMQIYYFTDGLFAGNVCGDDGMSTLSFSWTFVNYIMAFSTGIGMGGSIRYSLNKDDSKKANKYFRQTLRLLLLIAIVMFVLFIFTYKDILSGFGISGSLLDYCFDYSKVVIYGIFIQVFAYGLLPMLRNLGYQKQANAAVGLGYIVNVFLDYLLMIPIPLGMLGCGLAYLSGQLVIFIVCVYYSTKAYKEIEKDKITVKDNLLLSKDICFTGLGPIALFLANNISSTSTSTSYVSFGGSESLAAFSTSNYICGLTTQIIQSIVDGSQPIISTYHGLKEKAKTLYNTKLMYIFCFGLLLFTDLMILLFIKPIANSFGLSEVATNLIYEKCPFFMFFYDCYIFGRMTNGYLSSINKSVYSTIVTCTVPVTTIILLLFLPQMMGIDGVWWSIELADLASGILAIIFIIVCNKNKEE